MVLNDKNGRVFVKKAYLISAKSGMNGDFSFENAIRAEETEEITLKSANAGYKTADSLVKQQFNLTRGGTKHRKRSILL